jgi:hypothetical protein
MSATNNKSSEEAKKKPKRNFTEEAFAEVCRLYAEIQDAGRDAILSVMRVSLDKAIRIGEKLKGIRDGHKGQWVKFSKRLPFSLRTAQRYVKLSERRDELLRDGMSLTEAYDLLISPATDKLARDSVSYVNDVKQLPAPAESKSKPFRRSEISTKRLDRQLMHAQVKILQHLSEMLAQIKQQHYEAAVGFGDGLIVNGRELVQQGERLSATANAADSNSVDLHKQDSAT